MRSLGGHWALLQTSAWVGMIVQYSQRAGLKAGIAQTFDGEHPCSVCKAIQDGKNWQVGRKGGLGIGNALSPLQSQRFSG